MGDFIVATVCAPVMGTVLPADRVFGCFPTLDMSIRKSLCVVTWTMSVPTRHLLALNSILLGWTTMSPGLSARKITKLCVLGWIVTGLYNRILFYARFCPFWNLWAFRNGTTLRLLPPGLRIIGTVVPSSISTICSLCCMASKWRSKYSHPNNILVAWRPTTSTLTISTRFPISTQRFMLPLVCTLRLLFVVQCHLIPIMIPKFNFLFGNTLIQVLYEVF